MERAEEPSGSAAGVDGKGGESDSGCGRRRNCSDAVTGSNINLLTSIFESSCRLGSCISSSDTLQFLRCLWRAVRVVNALKQ